MFFPSLPKIRHTVFQRTAHRSCVNGANLSVNCHKTRVNILKSKYSIQTCLHSLIFGRVITIISNPLDIYKTFHFATIFFLLMNGKVFTHGHQ